MRLTRATAVLSLAALIGGCATPSVPANFYLLAAQPPAQAGLPPVPQNTWIGLGPIALPAYLDRPELVIRGSAHRLQVSDFDLWAGPLGREVTRVIETNLAGLLGTHRIVAHPWRPGLPVDWQLEIDIVQLDHFSDGTTHLRAHWSLFGATGPEPLGSGAITVTATGGTGFSSVAAGYTAVLRDLSKRLAQEVSEAGAAAHIP